MSNLEDYNGVWVFCEDSAGSLTKPTLEAIAAGRKVAESMDQKLVAVLLGYKVEPLAQEAIYYGADEALVCDKEQLEHYLCLPYTRVLVSLVTERRPNAFIFVADEVGRDLAPRVAYRLKTGLATDNIELEVEDYFHIPTGTKYEKLLIQIRPDFATRIAKIYTPKHRPQIATVRPGNFAPLKRDPDRSGRIELISTRFFEEDFAVILKGLRSLPKSKVDLEGAQAVVSIGLGTLRDGRGNPRNPLEGYKLAKVLADTVREKLGFKTEIGASRALIYAELKELEGLISKENQVGQTGRTVSPELYFAIGISGALQHRVGMQRAKRVVAINIDPSAPIFHMAHYPIVGDLYEEVPKLIEEIRRS